VSARRLTGAKLLASRSIYEKPTRTKEIDQVEFSAAEYPESKIPAPENPVLNKTPG
jgi:hypothetical protein